MQPNYPYQNGPQQPIQPAGQGYQEQVSFGDAIKKAIVENYCNFSGRASRSELWWFFLFNFLIGVVCGFLGDAGTIISGIVSLALLLPGLGLAVRRLHDIGKGGGWIFIALVPLIGAIILIVFYCKESEPFVNRFGPVPNLR